MCSIDWLISADLETAVNATIILDIVPFSSFVLHKYIWTLYTVKLCCSEGGDEGVHFKKKIGNQYLIVGGGEHSQLLLEQL